MKFMLQTPWPIGQFCIDAGVTIDLGKPEAQLSDWEKLARGRIPPIDALALDEECAQHMRRCYPGFLHRLRKAT